MTCQYVNSSQAEQPDLATSGDSVDWHQVPCGVRLCSTLRFELKYKPLFHRQRQIQWKQYKLKMNELELMRVIDLSNIFLFRSLIE